MPAGYGHTTELPLEPGELLPPLEQTVGYRVDGARGPRAVALDLVLAADASASPGLPEQCRAAWIRLLCALPTSAGRDRTLEDHADIGISVAAFDRPLDERSGTRPGLRDADDRLFGAG